MAEARFDPWIENPTAEELRRFDQQRQDKKVSNDDWESPKDPDSRIAKMKDGTTHLAYKAEHVVDLETELVLSATITPANHGDAETLCDSLVQAQMNMQAAGSKAEIKEGRGGQGLSQGQHVGTGERLRLADLYSRAEAASSQLLDGQAGGVASGGLCESAAGAWRNAAKSCSVCAANTWNGALPTSVKRAEGAEPGCVA